MVKKISIFGVILAVAVFVYILFFQAGNQERVVEDALVENDTYSLSFNYLEGEDGYELIESATSDNFLHSYVLVDKTALTTFQSEAEAVAPPTMSVFMFSLPEAEETEDEQPGRITRLQNWAQDNAGLTSFEQIYGTPKVIEIDGVKALEYSTDGTYQQSIYLASYRGFIYMFVGQYDRPTDVIKKDFEQLIASVRFE